MFVPDDPVRFEQRHHYPDTPSEKFVVLRGSPPEAFRRLDRWVEEQNFDGDGIAELTRRDGGMGMDYAAQIASGRDGRIVSRWKTEWPETPRSFTVGELQSFPPPLGDFDGDGLADLLITRDSHFQDFEPKSPVTTGKVPLLVQAISGKTGRRLWGGPSWPLPESFRVTSADESSEPWITARLSRVAPMWTQSTDIDRDGRPDLLQILKLIGQRRTEPKLYLARLACLIAGSRTQCVKFCDSSAPRPCHPCYSFPSKEHGWQSRGTDDENESDWSEVKPR